uniref:Protein kinase domain-containing protein n=1 Tax=Leersia perrieri TaxID=77586 RepID=A0A0D9W2D0_9ORYZ
MSRRAILLCSIIMVPVGDFAVGGIGGDEFIYNGFAGRHLIVDGAASITKDGILALTNTSSDIQGHGFHPHPINFDVLGTFSATFVFTISSDQYGRSGEGMAFVISWSPDFSSASPGPNLGLVGRYGSSVNHFCAIELDTVADPELADIDDNHVGIDLNRLTSISSTPAGYHYKDEIDNVVLPSFEALRLSSGSPMQVWVDYNGQESRLNVTLALVPMPKPYTQLLSASGINLSYLLGASFGRTSKLYVGFAASTSDKRGGSHQILGWSFNVSGHGSATQLHASATTTRATVQSRKQQAWLRQMAAFVCVRACRAFMCNSLPCALVVVEETRNRQDNNWEAELGPRRFRYKDLHRATNGFTRLLGKGGFGRVYGGVLAVSGKPVAVKRLSSESSSRQGLPEFAAEVIILGRLRHRNLVRLLGYCRHKDELLLVYEHMPTAAWTGTCTARLIAPCSGRRGFGVASALLYLHEDWEQVILHRDVKASNVLLDAEMNGRLGDFGLARLHDHGADAQTTHVAGTRGYLAPELQRFHKATKATDVFAFGAFVLEVVCGRRPVGLNARGEMLVLVEWVRETWAAPGGSIADAMDPRLEDYAAAEVELGLLCSHPLPAARPGIRLVMQYLDGDMALPEFSPDYLYIKDVDQVLIDVSSSSVATTITDLSGGR